jgi:hypothetical protein
MAKNPVFIKDNMESNLSSRENTIDDDKLKGKHFIYKGFQTEKERIVNFL